jgi:hypothetical protein
LTGQLPVLKVEIDNSSDSLFNRLMGWKCKAKEKEEEYEVAARKHTPPSCNRNDGTQPVKTFLLGYRLHHSFFLMLPCYFGSPLMALFQRRTADGFHQKLMGVHV